MSEFPRFTPTNFVYPWRDTVTPQEQKRCAVAALVYDFDLADKYPDMNDPEQAARFCIERTAYYESLDGGVKRLRDDLGELQAYIDSLMTLLVFYTPGVVDYEKDKLRAMGVEP